MRTTTSLAAILVFVLLVACGPAAPPSQNGGGSGETQEPAATPTTISPQDDGPVPPTATPPPPTEEPPPRATPTPTPTRHPDDPPYEPTPAPTRGPTPVPPSGPSLTNPPEPLDGIAACYTINLYASTAQELEYTGWCSEALMQDVIDNCAGIGTSEEEHRCGVQRLANVQLYFLREVGTPCFAISDENDRIACAGAGWVKADQHIRTLWATWAELLHTVDSDADVKERKAAMADCVVEKGFARPDPHAVLSWQEDKKPDERQPVRRQREAERATAEAARLTAMDQCARKAKLYDAQKEVWLSEIRRLQREDPAKVKPLLDEGIKYALEANGPAPFLTLRK